MTEREQALAMRKRQATLDEIATKLGRSKSTVCRWLQASEEEGAARVPGVRAGRPRKPKGRDRKPAKPAPSKTETAPSKKPRSTKPAKEREPEPSQPKAPATEPDVNAEVAELVSRLGLLESDPDAYLAAVRERLLPDILRMQLEARNQVQLSAYRDLAKLELDVTARIIAMMPKPPPDPATDPANLEARDTVRATLADRCRTVAGRLCTACRDRLGIRVVDATTDEHRSVAAP